MARAKHGGSGPWTFEYRYDDTCRGFSIGLPGLEFAKAWIARSDVANRIEVVCGAGPEVLAGFDAQSADAAFLDADKSGYPTYLEHCMRILRPGGLMMADNAFAFGQLFDERPTDPEVTAVREFNEVMPRQAGLQSVIVPLGDGCWVGVKT